VEALVRPLWRAAGSEAEAPPLATRPNSGIDPFVDGQGAISPSLGGEVQLVNESAQPIADRVAKNLEIISTNFQFVPDEPGFSRDLSLVPCYYLVLIVPPMDRILVR